MRLDRYLTLCDLGSRKEVKELITRGRVWMDGKPVRDAGAAVRGEVLVDGEPAAYRPLVALVMNKPAGVLIHPSRSKFDGTLANYVAGYYRKTGQKSAFHPLTRLDRDTFGIVLLAKNAHVHTLLQQGKVHEVSCVFPPS